MRGFLLDLTYSSRLLRKSPGFTLLAMLCLGLGIGVNTAIFSLLNFIYLRPFPVAAPDRLVVLSRAGSPLLSFPDYRDLRDRTQSLEGLAASNPTESSLDFDGEAHPAGAEAVSLNYARVIGVRPILGRWFLNEDERAAVLSYRTWQRLFHGDRQILGKRIRSESQTYTIVGVAPKEFGGIYLPLNMDLWVPLRAWAAQYPEMAARLEDRSRPGVFVFGRIKADVTAGQAGAELNAIATRLRAEQPRSGKVPAPLVVEHIRGVPNIQSRRAAMPISTVLMAVVGVVLLIACVNVGNLLLARGAARQREVATRIALGASRARLLRQLMSESLLLALGGGVLGFLLGGWLGSALESILPTTAFGEALRLDISPDIRVTAFTAVLAVATTLLFGLAPAWHASRADTIARLPEPRRRLNLRRISLAAQVSLSLMLLLTAGLFLRVLLQFQASDPGFAVAHRLYLTTYVSAPEFTDQTGRQFYTEALERVRALPGVKSAAITNLLPLTPINPNCASPPGGDPVPATSSAVSPGYLKTLRIPLIAGRDFSSLDRPGTQPVAMVNEALAKRMWPNQSALGRRLLVGCHDARAVEVVGVTRDARLVSLGQPPQPHVYEPFAQNYGGIQMIIVETGDSGIAESLRKAIVSTNPAVRIYGVHTLREWVDRSYWQVRWEAFLLGAFGWLALLLAAVGLYGVIAYQVVTRTREIGVRMAIGAGPADVMRLILGEGLRLTLIGMALGILASIGMARAMVRLLYAVSPTDLPTYAAVSLLWLLVASLACYLPARRAARLDPMAALRYE